MKGLIPKIKKLTKKFAPGHFFGLVAGDDSFMNLRMPLSPNVSHKSLVS